LELGSRRGEKSLAIKEAAGGRNAEILAAAPDYLSREIKFSSF
jgi:hypothetical protein